MDSTTLIMVLVLGVFVVYMIFASKNQKKKAQEHNKFRDNLKNGSIVMTQSGFVGKVVSSSENEIVLEYNGTQSVWLKRAIATEATLDKETEKLFSGSSSTKKIVAKKATAKKPAVKKSTAKKSTSKK